MIHKLISIALTDSDARTEESLQLIALEKISAGLPWITGVED